MATVDRTTRQLLLRVPQELHQRLAAQAARERRSMNAVANDVLQTAVAPTDQSAADNPAARRARLRARAEKRGLLAEPGPLSDRPPVASEELDCLWDRLVDESRGRGPVLDAELRADRERG